MPKYKRYSYVVYQEQLNSKHQKVAHAILGVEFNPRKANEVVDTMLVDDRRLDPQLKVLTDMSYPPCGDFQGETLRVVSIEYSSGAYSVTRLGRWYVWVGKE